MEVVEAWSANWGMQLNPKKCGTMVFGDVAAHAQMKGRPLRLGGEPVPNLESQILSLSFLSYFR